MDSNEITKVLYINLNCDNFEVRTQNLSTTELGAYMRLIMYARRHNGQVPLDDKMLVRITKTNPLVWAKLKPMVVGMLETSEDTYSVPEVKIALQQRKSLHKASMAGVIAKSQKRKDKILPPVNREVAASQPNKKEEIGKIEKIEKIDTEYAVRESSITTTSQEETLFPASPGKEYFFESGVIRLNEKDFKHWQRCFPKLNLMAELESLRGWDALTPDNWFHAVPKYLKKQNQRLEETGGIKYFKV